MPIQAIKRLLEGHDTLATPLLVLAHDRLGESLLGSAPTWDPETIRLEVNAAFGLKISNISFNRLMAAVEIVTSDSFYRELTSFIRLCNVLYGGTMDPRVWDPATAVEAAWGLTEGMLLWPPDSDDPEPFHPDIVLYLQVTLQNEGLLHPPEALQVGAAGLEKAWADVQNGFSDDPTMYAAIAAMAADRTDAIDTEVRARLNLLLDQLHAIQPALQHGDARQFVESVRQILGQQHAESSSPA